MLTPTGSLHVPRQQYRAEAPQWAFHAFLERVTWLAHVVAWFCRDLRDSLKRPEATALALGGVLLMLIGAGLALGIVAVAS